MAGKGMKPVLEKLEALGRRYQELDQLMARPEVIDDYQRMQEIAKERATLEGLVRMHRQYKDTLGELESVRILLEEEPRGEMAVLAEEERDRLGQRLEELGQKIRFALLPRDPNDEKDVIVEVRAGAGGEEASLFAADLFRMYSQYALSKGWHVDVIDANRTGIGGLKEMIFEVRGKGVFSRLRYERGVHRVQRVPSTETSGRLHTSTATVAVLPEAEDVELNIGPDDLRIDVFRAGGHGGQGVNKVESAVRITHIPTGITASCQDERSQLKNKSKAMAVLKARVLDRELQRHQQELSAERRSQVGGGERSEKIRTYNFPQDRVSDHRINLTLHGLERIMAGELDELIGALISYVQSSQLEQVVA